MTIVEQLQSIVGARNVLSGDAIGGYGHDWAGALHWAPICVVRPASTAEVSAVLKATYAGDVPVVPIAGNTGVSGGSIADGAVMLSLDRLNRIDAVNAATGTVRVEAGAIVANIHEAVAEHGLIFPLLFGAQGTAQIGGALATNAGGSNVLRYGNVRALCLGIEAALPDGRVMDLMTSLHKDNSGYDLRDLLIGAEGTLGVITGAVLKLLPRPKAYVTAMLACHDLGDALDVLPRVQAATGRGVEAFEYMPGDYIGDYLAGVAGAREPFDKRYPVNILLQAAAASDADGTPDGQGEVPLVTKVQDCLAGALTDGLIADAVIAKSKAEADEMWRRRDMAAEIAFAHKPFVGLDIALPTDQLPAFLDRAQPAVLAVDAGAGFTWVAHLGDGNVHFTVRLSGAALKDGVTQAVEAVAADLGGTFSAEHGVGTFKLPSMARLKDPVALEVMRAIKRALDPKGLMNPGKVIPG